MTNDLATELKALRLKHGFLKSKTVLLPSGLKITILETLILISMLMTCLRLNRSKMLSKRF